MDGYTLVIMAALFAFLTGTLLIIFNGTSEAKGRTVFIGLGMYSISIGFMLTGSLGHNFSVLISKAFGGELIIIGLALIYFGILKIFSQTHKKIAFDIALWALFLFVSLLSGISMNIKVILISVMQIYYFVLNILFLMKEAKGSLKLPNYYLVLIFVLSTFIQGIRAIMGIGDFEYAGIENSMAWIHIWATIIYAILPFSIALGVFWIISIQYNLVLLSQANKDPLTGIYNRRGLQDRRNREINVNQDNSLKTAVVMCDLDDFKKVNDSYGHDFGDFVLVKVSKLLEGNLRTSDMVARYGGEEFVMVFHSVNEDIIRTLMKKFVKIINTAIISNGKTNVRITMSFGVHFIDDCDTDIEKAIPFADKAMYCAKANGKNKAVLYKDETFVIVA